MRLRFVLPLVAVVGFVPFVARTAPDSIAGRWDLTVTAPDGTYPAWVEIGSGAAPWARIQGRVATVKKASDVSVSGPQATFSSKEWFGKELPVKWELALADGGVKGKLTRSDGQTADITGVRAPALLKPEPKTWAAAVRLFDGTDLNGWEPFTTEPGKPVENHWVAEDGNLVNQAPGANIRTTDKFNDFKLHIELNCPDKGNSGIYLRGRYEMQVSYEGEDPMHAMDAIYGYLSPKPMKQKPGQWETFEIELVGRTVTIWRDGFKTIDHQQIPGITGGALDSHEGDPGPIYLQGDHTGGMKYRNITIQTPTS